MIASIVNTFNNCFKIPELKSRILFTLVVLAICRLICIIPVPGLNGAALANYTANAGSLLGLYGMFSGGALQHCAIGALGIMPYISSTIVLQLLTAVVPQLSKMAREEGGRTKIIQYGRYGTVLLCLGWGVATAIQWQHPEKLFQGFQGNLVMYPETGFWHSWYFVQTVLILTTGSVLLMWLGEQITDRGIGNGVSLIITINILSRLPDAFIGLRYMFTGVQARGNLGNGVALLLLLAGVIAGIIAITQAQRKIPVQYAQRAVGRKVYSGGTSFMPLRVNYSGVMPIIFAQAILMVPAYVFKMLGSGTSSWSKFFNDLAVDFAYGAWIYLVVYSIMILFFSYFWVATQFNELQIADDLKKNGGYIPGVRPGQATSDYLHNAMSRITLAGAFFLIIIAIIPMILSQQMGIDQNVASFFGGTGMLIVVGVMLDTMRQMESHLLMRHYDGFLKKGRLKGRF